MEMQGLIYRMVKELDYVQSSEDCGSSLCATPTGAELVTEGIKFLGVKDLSAEEMPSVVFYGPHPCDSCGKGLIAKSGGGGELNPLQRFDYPHPPIYPNTEWREHVCHLREVCDDGYFCDVTAVKP